MRTLPPAATMIAETIPKHPTGIDSLQEHTPENRAAGRAPPRSRINHVSTASLSAWPRWSRQPRWTGPQN